MKEPRFWINLATEYAKSSAGLLGIAPPNSVYLGVKRRKMSVGFRKDCNKQEYNKTANSETCNLPASPSCSKHFGLIILVRKEIFTVETIASIYLLDNQSIHIWERERCIEVLITLTVVNYKFQRPTSEAISFFLSNFSTSEIHVNLFNWTLITKLQPKKIIK